MIEVKHGEIRNVLTVRLKRATRNWESGDFHDCSPADFYR